MKTSRMVLLALGCLLASIMPIVVESITKEEVAIQAQMPTPDLIKRHGYPVEIHTVTTDDEYILEMHRIPYSDKSPARKGKNVVLLQHGLLASSADWVIMGPGQGLAYILADLGYDVWMGNSRGNLYSRNHVYLSPDDSDFWQFDWHEMGVHDIPSVIDYMLAKTGESKIHYIGHSQGTTQFYVMGSEKPEYNSKIKAMFSLAPIAFMNHLENPFMHVISYFTFGLETLLNLLGVDELKPSKEFMGMVGKTMCDESASLQFMYENLLFAIVGFDEAQLNKTMIPVMLGHTPAGAATRQVIHYAQELSSGEFQQFDHHLGNLYEYGQFFPPKYNLKKVTCPVALHYSNNDLLASPVDVERLYKGLGNPIGKFLVPLDSFNHLDFLWANDVKPLVYDLVIDLMSKYTT